ncbi:hypothetical protein TorRG33x02_038930 [Trema orientale]|uniref:Uncharacterized protein n=1 Tax=Trema orientale TaxID=63057 RepID=A0A2P5FQP1_TREOI|nr:hypothetical protein TorRG33x02_038930 [Trema orientale]
MELKFMMTCHHSVGAQSQVDMGEAKNATPDWVRFRILTRLQVQALLSGDQGYSQAEWTLLRYEGLERT